jgi:hypothetical protein
LLEYRYLQQSTKLSQTPVGFQEFASLLLYGYKCVHSKI